MTLPFDLTPLAVLWLALALFGAAYVRGYSGFGFAALAVSSASLVTNPMHFVPVVILADVVLTAQQARGIRLDVDWRRVATLFGGAFFGVPLGVWVLAGFGADTARIVISLFVLAMCGLLLAGWRMAGRAGRGAHVGVGLVSGLANGAAVGGLPVAVFFAAQPVSAATFRATLIAYFTLLDLWSLPMMGRAGFITRDTWLVTALALPILSLGVWLGGRHFFRAEPQSFRRFAILLLAVLAGFALLKSWV
ncbi:MAG: sulfite exporter TauE/SafE family protein [Paracoccaceae bacterium]|nr:sulfite exporter TauE/SafE family protein [Paracoccaceae bacterium]